MFRLDFSKENVKKEAKEWAQSIVVALLLTLFIRAYVIQAFKIPSGSMRPTLMEGDKLFVSKLPPVYDAPNWAFGENFRFGGARFDTRSLKRGDIVVFKYPEDPKKDFIKRLVGFEGETVEIREGKVYVDDQPLTDPVFQKTYYYNHDPFGGPNEKIKVPEDTYYVLGDNSANSTDSRFWGFVPEKNMVGRAVFRWWPLPRVGVLIDNRSNKGT